MLDRLEVYRQLREISGWGRLRSVLFLYSYGAEFARVSVSALEGVRVRSEGNE